LHGGKRARQVPIANDGKHAAAPTRAGGNGRDALDANIDPRAEMKWPA
jgi:hypothetical protein